MTEISMDREMMRAMIGQIEDYADDVSKVLSGFSSSADGGLASEKIAYIVRAALESAQLSADSVTGLSAIARVAIDDQTATEQDILDSLDNFLIVDF